MDSTPRTVTLRRIDGEVSVPLPADVLAQSGLGDGETVQVALTAEGLVISRPGLAPDVRQAFEDVSVRYAETLRQLAQ